MLGRGLGLTLDLRQGAGMWWRLLRGGTRGLGRPWGANLVAEGIGQGRLTRQVDSTLGLQVCLGAHGAWLGRRAHLLLEDGLLLLGELLLLLEHALLEQVLGGVHPHAGLAYLSHGRELAHSSCRCSRTCLHG